jgi:hypothetical protein
VAKVRRHRAHVLGFQDLVAQAIDLLTLLVRDVVVVQQLFANIEVARFDLALRRFDRARHHARLDGFALGHVELVHDHAHAVTREDAQQRVFHGQVEARFARVALPAGTAAQLVVDPTRLMALGADDHQAARSQHLVVQLLPLGTHARRALLRHGRIERRIALHRLDLLLDAAAQHDVGTAAGHVRRDGDHPGTPRLRDDVGLALVLLGVEDLMRQLSACSRPAISSEFSIEVVPTSTG